MISAALAVLETEEQRNELSDVYQQNESRFFSIAFSKLHNKQDAEEAIQEAFLSIANNPECFFELPLEKRASYVSVIVRNHSIKLWNMRNKIEENEVELKGDIPDKNISFDENMCVECSCEEIYRFIDTLSETAKTALYFKLYLNMSYADIGNELGITEEAAKKRIARAAGKIMEFVEGNGK